VIAVNGYAAKLASASRRNTASHSIAEIRPAHP